MGNAHSNTGRGDEPTHDIRDIGDGDTKREHRPVSSELTEGEAEASNRKSTINPAPESSYSYIKIDEKLLYIGTHQRFFERFHPRPPTTFSS